MELSYNGGVTNTMVQLVDINQEKAVELRTMLEPIVLKAKQYYSRVNHLFFQKPTNKTYQFDPNITCRFSAR